MARVLYQLIAVSAVIALAHADNNACDSNSCGIVYGREVPTPEIYVPPGREYYVSPPKDICGRGVEPLGVRVIACGADKAPDQFCVTAVQEIIHRTGSSTALMELRMVVYCPMSDGSHEACPLCPVLTKRAPRYAGPHAAHRRQPVTNIARTGDDEEELI